MTTTIVISAIALIVGFVVGILVGRVNPKKVEVTVEEAKAILAKAGIKV
jgi:uncharacterized membrane-anchored protein YhcB (DUF1043 family)